MLGFRGIKKNILQIAKRFLAVNFPLYLQYRFTSLHLRFSDIDISGYQKMYILETPWLKYATENFDPTINKSLNGYSMIVESAYLYHLKLSVFIEPNYGWAILNKTKVIKQSLPFGLHEKTPLPHHILYQRKKNIKIDKAVSIRYNWMNYWHFYNDVIGQLYMLEKINFDKKIYVIIPESCKSLQYVQHFFKTDFAKKWNWLFQDKDTNIHVKELYLCKSISNVREHFIFSKSFFVPLMTQPYNRAIFITRAKYRGRYLSNHYEIEKTLEHLKIEIIDCDKLSLQQQIDTVSAADLIIGIHGAGLTNMIHRYPNSCTVIEIFPPDVIPPHYYWLALELGFDYYALRGSFTTTNTFYLNPDFLKETIYRLKEKGKLTNYQSQEN